MPRSPQGQPVLLQAGQSGRGIAFAARWAELVFASYPSLEVGRKQYAALKAAVEKAGRDPASVKIAPAVKIIVAETSAQADEQKALTESLAKPIDALALLCEVLNVDFSKRPYELPFTDAELASVSWHSLRDKVIAKSGKKNPSVRDFVEAQVAAHCTRARPWSEPPPKSRTRWKPTSRTLRWLRDLSHRGAWHL